MSQAKDPSSLVADKLAELGDQALEQAGEGWLQRLDEHQRAALVTLLAALAIGPLGMGLLGMLDVLFGGAKVPGISQLEAVVALAVMTGPVFAWTGVLGFSIAKGVLTPVVLGIASIAAYGAGALLAGMDVPATLGDFYCYAALNGSAIDYEQACRAFDGLGFLQQTAGIAGSPTRSPEVAQWAFLFVAEARGTVMAAAGAVAGAAAGYLAGREA